MRNLALKAYTWAHARKTNEEGQTVIEYALVVAGVSIVLIVGLLTFGDGLIESAQTRVGNFAWPS